ncbi:Protein of unknown function, partial [Cotesia congregata]
TDIAVGKKMAARKQFPLICAESVTTHKSQGQTYPYVCVHNQGMTRTMQYVAYSRVTDLKNLYIDGNFKPPAPLDNTSNLKVEIDRLKNEKRLITFEQPLDDLHGIKIIFHNALSLRKYIGCVRNDKWFHGADVMIFAETRTLPNDDISIDGFDIEFRSDEKNVSRKFLRRLVVYKRQNCVVSTIINVTQDLQLENKVEHVDLVTLKINDLFVIGGYKSPNATRDLFKKCMNNMTNSCDINSHIEEPKKITISKGSKNVPLKNTTSVLCKKKTDEVEKSTSLSVEEILLKISDSDSSLDKIQIILDHNSNTISKLTLEIYNATSSSINNFHSNLSKNSHRCEIKLNIEDLSSQNAAINKLLNETFTFSDVIKDGNCLFRTLAKSISLNENEYMNIRLFIIKYIRCNKTKYNTLLSRGAISVQDEDGLNIPDPKIDDFLRIIARDHVWGNEGSLYAISDALKIIVVVIGVASKTHKMSHIFR